MTPVKSICQRLSGTHFIKASCCDKPAELHKLDDRVFIICKSCGIIEVEGFNLEDSLKDSPLGLKIIIEPPKEKDL